MENTKNTIIRIYIIFIISIALNFVPSVSAQTIGALLFFIMIIAAYVYRFKSEKGSIMHSHMRYLIKSFWIASLFLAIGILLSTQFADHSAINNAVDNLMESTHLNESQMQSVAMEYTKQNLLVFAAALLPSVFYLLYRCIKGIIFLKKHKTFDDYNSWF